MSSSARRFENIYIAISGLIGAGKTTLATALGECMKLPVFHEPVDDNPYLSLFYKDMKEHAFAMQIHLLNERFQQQQQIVWQNKGAVQDRSIYEDSVFAEMLCKSGLMSELNYETYQSLFKHMSNFMRRPTLIVYLYVTPEQALARIRSRARSCEDGITIEYLRALYESYEKFITEISKTIMVIRIDNTGFPSAEDIAHTIMCEYRQRTNVIEAIVDRKYTSLSANISSDKFSDSLTTAEKHK